MLDSKQISLRVESDERVAKEVNELILYIKKKNYYQKSIVLVLFLNDIDFRK